VVRTAPGFTGIYKEFVAGGWNSLPFDPESAARACRGCSPPRCRRCGRRPHGLRPGAAAEPGRHRRHPSSWLAEQKAAYLPKMISGEWTGTMNLTEPQAGSDLGQLKSRAVKSGDHYLITGQKIFITYGEHDLTENIVHLVLARTPDAPAGVRASRCSSFRSSCPAPTASRASATIFAACRSSTSSASMPVRPA